MAKFPKEHEHQQQLCQGLVILRDDSWNVHELFQIANTQLVTEFCSIYISRNVLNSLTRLVSRLWPNNLVNFTVWCRSFPELEMFSTVRCHFTERRLMTRSCFITPASPQVPRWTGCAPASHWSRLFAPWWHLPQFWQEGHKQRGLSCVDEGQF